MAMPNKDQASALVRFAELHGHYWKKSLRNLWAGDPFVFVLEVDRPLLQQIRNQFGPRWLNKVSLAQVKEVIA